MSSSYSFAGGSGSGSDVTSVNGETGDVVLDATDVGAATLTSSAASTSAVGDSATAGAATTAAKADHKHGREGFGAVTAQTSYGSSSSNGTATTLARSDHTHGTPSLTSSAASTSAVGDSASAGSATAPAKADHVHGREGFGSSAPPVAAAAGSAGSAATLSRSDHAHPVNQLGPGDHGLIAWNFPPYLAVSSAVAPTNNTVFLMKIPIPAATTITNVILAINDVTSVSLTSGQNFAGLYSSGKSLLSATADQTTSWTSTTGALTIPLTSAQSVSAGYVYVAMLLNGTTLPKFYRAGGNINNVGLAASTAVFATGGTGTSLPSSVTTSLQTTASWWAAVS